MKPILIFTHDQCEPPGYIETLLRRKDIPFHQICLATGEDHGDYSLEDISALIFMGGEGDVNQPTEWMQAEMRWIELAQKADIPVLGICLGAQLMCKAFGGQVCSDDELEIGWHPLELLSSARDHPWFNGLPQRFDAFHWHAHSCRPPSSVEVLASSACTPCQAFVLGRHLGLQFHLEMSPPIIESLIELYASDLEARSDCVQSRQQIQESIAQKCDQAFAIADRLLGQWLSALSN